MSQKFSSMSTIGRKVTAAFAAFAVAGSIAAAPIASAGAEDVAAPQAEPVVPPAPAHPGIPGSTIDENPSLGQGSSGNPFAVSFPDDPFYDPAPELEQANAGDVLKTRELPFHAFGFGTPLQTVQIQYRSEDSQGRPSAAMTSVIKPPFQPNGRVISYNSIYDSVNPDHGPSRAIAGDVGDGVKVPSIESGVIAPLLSLGYTVVMTDIEGPGAHFAAGPENGKVTLDGLRAASRAPETGVAEDAPLGLLGYSGGAIGSAWAATLAPSYAPDINDRIVGNVAGGLLVNPENNLHYLEGSTWWAGALPLALVGLTRAYGIDMDPYLTDLGKDLVARVSDKSIVDVLGDPVFANLTFDQVVKPEYADMHNIPGFTEIVNDINLLNRPVPTVPSFMGQGDAGTIFGTPVHPEVGPGDGIMVYDDYRALVQNYCEGGNAVSHREYTGWEHYSAALPFLTEGVSWLIDRFNGVPAPTEC